MIFVLAWRNVWRNKRRTFITWASVFLAVVLSSAMMSLKEGFYVNMINAMVKDYIGYAQLLDKRYYEDRSIDYSLVFNDSLRARLDQSADLKGYAPRVESFALSVSDKATKGTMVIGIDPAKEAKLIGIDDRITQGEYLDKDDRAVLIGSGLASHLKINPDDTLVVLGAGYHGISAVGKYVVKGIVKLGSPEINKQLVFMPIKEAQRLFDVPNMYTSIVLFPDDPNKTASIVKELSLGISDKLEVMPWQELAPDLVKMIETDRVEGYVFIFILYMVISFGLFGTSLMMLAERRHEFGIMVAVGMKRIRLAIVVLTEVVIISLIGAILGIAGAFPISWYFNRNPVPLGGEINEMVEEYGFEFVLQPSIAPEIFVQQAVIILVIAVIISTYSTMKLLKLDAVNAMRI